MRYTTYFYTAAEAVVHGYHDDTDVRIVSMATGEPVWTGRIDAGETELVPTGAGTYRFISDKKATILVGTPSSCTMVGYWARDEEGSFRSDHFFVQLPLQPNGAEDQVAFWAWEPTTLTVRDRGTGRTLFSGPLPACGRHVFDAETVAGLGASVLEVRASSAAVSVQVYFDQGFAIPAADGRGAGREFLTAIGTIGGLGSNELVLMSQGADARVTVRDLDSQQLVFEGRIEAGTAHTIPNQRLRYLHIRADQEITAMVAPASSHGYAEHHYAAGLEGTGIDRDFLLPTPGQVWLFSYFDRNEITIEDAASGELAWRGTLDAGQAHAVRRPSGLLRVRGSAALSVMGGDQACGAEFSPAGRLFQVDEALLRAVVEIRRERRQQAAARGQRLSEAEAAAPLTAAERQEAARRVRRATGSSVLDAAAVEERLGAMAGE
ncbi:MAG: hypothetical protein OEY14_07850 [Myxococcales bacterium]|nr:hypothetical protein [Myxococcales bacterium]